MGARGTGSPWEHVGGDQPSSSSSLRSCRGVPVARPPWISRDLELRATSQPLHDWVFAGRPPRPRPGLRPETGSWGPSAMSASPEMQMNEHRPPRGWSELELEVGVRVGWGPSCVGRWLPGSSPARIRGPANCRRTRRPAVWPHAAEETGTTICVRQKVTPLLSTQPSSGHLPTHRPLPARWPRLHGERACPHGPAPSSRCPEAHFLGWNPCSRTSWVGSLEQVALLSLPPFSHQYNGVVLG